MSTFYKFGLPAEINQALERMKYTEPTPIQLASIPVAMSGRDILGSAQTGTGKTAAFGIPLICKLMSDPEAQALILAPTRELAVQIVDVMRQLTHGLQKMGVVLIIGGVGMEHQRRALAGFPRIVVATPGRMMDHVQRAKGVLSRVRFLVLDEADRMLEMGFKPQLQRIKEVLSNNRQTLLYSATYPSDIANLAKEWLKNPERVAVGSISKPIEKIAQEMREISGDTKATTVLEELEKREGSVLIFARTKRRTDRLAHFLKTNGIAVCHIHGDRSQGQRQTALTGFRDGKYRVLVATDIAARGLDVPHIEHVINYDLPLVAEDYLHRIGRTARAGRAGSALCLVAPDERSLWRAIQRLMANAEGLPSDSRERPTTQRPRGYAMGDNSRGQRRSPARPASGREGQRSYGNSQNRRSDGERRHSAADRF